MGAPRDPTPTGVLPLYARDLSAIAGIERLRFFPLAVTAGEGPWLIEEGGRRLLDLSASWSAAGLGYGHPAVVAAVTEAVRTMPGASVLSSANAEAASFAEELLSLVPGEGARRVYLGHSGSDANEVVVRTTRRATGRHRVMAFHGSYHGGLTASRSFSGLYVDAGVQADPALSLVSYPDPTRTDPAVALEATLAELDALWSDAVPPHEVAALLVEPLMSDGGLIVPPPGFLARLADRCRAHGILLVCDEVKAGLGRTGWLHAFQADGVVPDIVTFGKSIGGGLPLSAAVGPADILDVEHGSALLTTAGNPVSSAAGRAVLQTIVDEDLPARAARIGDRLRAELARALSPHRIVRDVRGRGLMLGIEIVRPDGEQPDGLAASKVAFRAWQLGAAVFCVGPHGNVLEITPPLVIGEPEIDLAVETLVRAVADVVAGRVPNGAVADYAGW